MNFLYTYELHNSSLCFGLISTSFALLCGFHLINFAYFFNSCFQYSSISFSFKCDKIKFLPLEQKLVTLKTLAVRPAQPFSYSGVHPSGERDAVLEEVRITPGNRHAYIMFVNNDLPYTEWGGGEILYLPMQRLCKIN